MCYCFKRDNQAAIFENCELANGKVNYSTQLPEIAIYQDRTTDGMLGTLTLPVVFTKPMEWNYDKEVRYLTIDSDKAEKYKPSTLVAIKV